jgi:hypothetical protein
LGTIHVEYIRTSKSADGTSTRVGGALDLPLADDTQWQSVWRDTLTDLRGLVESTAVRAPSSESPNRGEPPDPEGRADGDSEATAEVSQPSPIVPGENVTYSGCRVMFNPEHKSATPNRKENVRMRIGNPAIPGRYVDAKSFEPEVMSAMRALRKGDIVNIEGFFDKPWTMKNSAGEDEQRFDLVVEAISRV